MARSPCRCSAYATRYSGTWAGRVTGVHKGDTFEGIRRVQIRCDRDGNIRGRRYWRAVNPPNSTGFDADGNVVTFAEEEIMGVVDFVTGECTFVELGNNAAIERGRFSHEGRMLNTTLAQTGDFAVVLQTCMKKRV